MLADSSLDPPLCCPRRMAAPSITLAPDSQAFVEQLLSTFRNWCIGSSALGAYDHDTAHLFSSLDMSDNTVGMAGVGVMCSHQAGGIDQMTASVSANAVTLAHELGHELSMQHDGEGPQSGCSADARHIMAATSQVGVASTGWSNCSAASVNEFMPRLGCLDNRPTALWGDPICTNGFVEEACPNVLPHRPPLPSCAPVRCNVC